MTLTPENPEILREYEESLKDRKSLPFGISFHVPDDHKHWKHGDVMDVKIIGHLPDGSKIDLAYPDKVQICLNLWGADEQTNGFLEWIVETWKPMVCFETGTHKGRSTKAISGAMEQNGVGHITTVDATDHGVEARTPRVTFVHGHLPEILESDPSLMNLKDIDMAYLDGPHTALEVQQEFNFVAHRVSPRGCYVIFDDAASSAWSDVGEFVKGIGGFVLPTPHGLGVYYIGPK